MKSQAVIDVEWAIVKAFVAYAVGLIREQIDEEGCGSTMAALSFHSSKSEVWGEDGAPR
jgi:hypothetical protein